MPMNLFSRLQISVTIKAIALALALIGTVASQQANAADQIIEVRNGSVTIQRDNKSQAAGVGTTLRARDEIRPTSGAVITVLCNNNSTRQVRRASGLGSICPDSVGPRYPTDGRGGCSFLAFLNHRCIYATQLRVADPTLRWPSITGASQYQVQLSQANQILWQQTVTGTQIHYEGPPLQPGATYQLLVTAVGQATESPYRLSLAHLDDTQAQAVQAAIAQIQTQNLSPESQAIALSTIYQEAGKSVDPNQPGLVLDAIATLEPLVTAGNQTSYVHRSLGDLYLQIRLLDLAIDHYQATLRLSQATPDQENQAAAQIGLANIAAAKGDRAEAERWLTQARQGYVALGNTEQVDLVDQWLSKLNP